MSHVPLEKECQMQTSLTENPSEKIWHQLARCLIDKWFVGSAMHKHLSMSA